MHILSSPECVFWATTLSDLKIRQVQGNNCNEWQQMLIASWNSVNGIYSKSPGFSIFTKFHPHFGNIGINATMEVCFSSISAMLKKKEKENL